MSKKEDIKKPKDILEEVKKIIDYDNRSYNEKNKEEESK